jgi:SnoaL-like domain
MRTVFSHRACPVGKPDPSVRHRVCHARPHMTTGEGAANCDELVRELWARFDSGKFRDATSLFADDAVYHDTLYASPFSGKARIAAHFANMERAFATNLSYVVDDVAASETSAGVRWHVELENGTRLPFSRGASTYKVVRQDGGELLFSEVCVC